MSPHTFDIRQHLSVDAFSRRVGLRPIAVLQRIKNETLLSQCDRKGKGRGVAAHPAVKISVQSWRDVRVFAQGFGLTPSSRTRVQTVAVGANTPQEGEKHQQDAEDFLFRSKVIGHVGRDGRRKDDA